MSKRIIKITGSWFNIEITYSPTVAIGISLLLALLFICCVTAPSFAMRVLFLFSLLIFLLIVGYVLFKGTSIVHEQFEKKKSTSESKKSTPTVQKDIPSPKETNSQNKPSGRKEPPMKKVPIPTEVAKEANAPALDEWRDFLDPDI